MVDVFAAEYSYGVGAKTPSSTFGTDPYNASSAATRLDLGLSASIQNFLTDEITSIDGRDVTGSGTGEEGGAPSIKALRGSLPLAIPRCKMEDVAFLMSYMMAGTRNKLTGSTASTPNTIGKQVLQLGSTPAASANLAWYAMFPSAIGGELKRFTLEAFNGDFGGRFLDCVLNSVRFRMETGASARSLAAECDVIVPSAKIDRFATAAAIPSGEHSGEIDAGSMRIRISKAAGDTSARLKAMWDTTARSNILAVGDTHTMLAGTKGSDWWDATGVSEYWEWRYNNNVDIDAAYSFNSGTRMGRINRGQRNQTLEIGLPFGFEDQDFLADSVSQQQFSAEIIVRGKSSTESTNTFYSGFRIIFPTLYLQSVPQYLVGPQVYQRLQFRAAETTKAGGHEPTAFVDVITPTLTSGLAGSGTAVLDRADFV